MSQYHFDPNTYRQLIEAEVPGYSRLQRLIAEQTAPLDGPTILELGTGTGVTSLEVLKLHPDSELTGIDASEGMLAMAKNLLPSERTTLIKQRFEDPLPPGPFGLVFSALAIHHLESDSKKELFGRIASVLTPGGRFVMGDVVIPTVPVKTPIPTTPGFDHPSLARDQINWLGEAGLNARIVWEEGELAVLVADKP